MTRNPQVADLSSLIYKIGVLLLCASPLPAAVLTVGMVFGLSHLTTSSAVWLAAQVLAGLALLLAWTRGATVAVAVAAVAATGMIVLAVVHPEPSLLGIPAALMVITGFRLGFLAQDIRASNTAKPDQPARAIRQTPR